MAFDTSKSQLTKNNFALGYSTGDFVLHTNVNDGQVFGGSVYQKVNRHLETGVNLGWTASKNETSFGIGCKSWNFMSKQFTTFFRFFVQKKKKTSAGKNVFFCCKIDPISLTENIYFDRNKYL